MWQQHALDLLPGHHHLAQAIESENEICEMWKDLREEKIRGHCR